MTTSSIRETVAQHLSPTYLNYGGEAITALEQREAQFKADAAEAIRTAARQAGISDYEVEQTLIDAGLVERTPEPANQESINTDSNGVLNDLVAEVRRISDRLDNAARQVSRHGIRF